MSFELGPVSFPRGPVENKTRKRRGQISFELEMAPASLAESIAIEYQVLGMAESSDPVAIVWADDATGWTGIYDVLSVTVSPVERYLATGWQTVSLTVARVPNAEIEADYTLTYRTDVPTSYYIAALHGFDTAGTDETKTYASDSDGFNLTAGIDLGGPGDTDRTIKTGGKAATSLKRVQVRQGIQPERFNDGPATVEAYVAGPGWFVLPGGPIPEGADARVSNGIIRVAPIVDTTYLLVESWTGSAWSDLCRVHVVFASETGGFARRWQVRKNTRAQVVLRCHWIADSHHVSRWVDLTITRGVTTARVTLSNGLRGNAVTYSAQMYEHDGSAMSSATIGTPVHGIQGDANGDGEEATIIADESESFAVLNETISFSSATAVQFAIGSGAARMVDEFRTNYRVIDRLVP